MDFGTDLGPLWGGPWTLFSCVFRWFRVQIRFDPPLGAQLPLDYSQNCPSDVQNQLCNDFKLIFCNLGSVLAAIWVDFCRVLVRLFGARRQIGTTTCTAKHIPDWEGSAAAAAASK